MEIEGKKIIFRSAEEYELEKILSLLYGSVEWDMLYEDFLAVIRHDGKALSLAVTDDGEYIGGLAFMKINEVAATFGIYYVKEKYQGKGIGMRLHEYGRNHVKHLNITFTSVETMILKYQLLYYPILSDMKDSRYCGKIDKSTLTFSTDISITDYSSENFIELCHYDEIVFNLNRENFLSVYLPLVKGLIVVAMKNNQICGYGILRKTSNKIGPLLADDISIAHTIIGTLINKLCVDRNYDSHDVILDIPNTNSGMMDLALKNNMAWVFTVTRMYSKEEIPINWSKVHSFHSFLH